MSSLGGSRDFGGTRDMPPQRERWGAPNTFRRNDSNSSAGGGRWNDDDRRGGRGGGGGSKYVFNPYCLFCACIFLFIYCRMR